MTYLIKAILNQAMNVLCKNACIFLAVWRKLCHILFEQCKKRGIFKTGQIFMFDIKKREDKQKLLVFEVE